MSEAEFYSAVIQSLGQLVFLGECVAIATSFVAGLFLCRFVILAKNQRSIF